MGITEFENVDRGRMVRKIFLVVLDPQDSNCEEIHYLAQRTELNLLLAETDGEKVKGQSGEVSFLLLLH